jgi:phosphatidylglycerophosphate synthase
MLDRTLRRVLDPWLDRLARPLARAGIAPLTVTALGCGCGVAAAGAVALGHGGVGAALLLAGRLADGLDGAVARAAGRAGPVGGFADIVADLLVWALLVFAFAVADPVANALAAAWLAAAFIATAATFLAHAVLVAQRGGAPSPDKSFRHASGLAEGTETIAFFLLVCIVPDWFAVAAWVFGALCWVTALARAAAGLRGA